MALTHPNLVFVSRARPRAGSMLATGLVALLASGCSARADIPEVVVTQSDVAFEGVPRIPGFAPIEELTTSFDHPQGFGLPEYFNPELYPTEVKVMARGDMQDLSFLSEVTLTLASRAEDAPPPRMVASYERADGEEVGRQLDLSPDTESDVLDYWGTKEAYYEMTLRGDDLPEQAWAVDVIVEFRGRLSVGD
jgi:hypothetical protein